MVQQRSRSRSASTHAAGLLLLALIAGTTCDRGDEGFRSRWDTVPDRRWAGPDYWANRLQDWRVHDGRLEAVASGPMRTVHLLTHRVGLHGGTFETSVRLGPLPGPGGAAAGPGRAGVLLGAGGASTDYRAAALVHHSPGPGGGLAAGVDGDGRVYIRDFAEENVILIAGDEGIPFDSATLTVRAVDDGDGPILHASAALYGTTTVEHAVSTTIDPDRIGGNVALFSDAPADRTGYWFRDWRVSGSRLEHHPDRAFGPILATQHTLSHGSLKLTAQLAPVAEADAGTIDLQVRDGGSWRSVATVPVIVPGYTATFRIDDWDSANDVPYRVAYDLAGRDGSTEAYTYRGTVRRDPVDEPEIVVAAFTGNHNVSRPLAGRFAGVDGGWFPWDVGAWFPHGDIVAHVRAQDPDLLFFSGDQVYEGASPTAADLSHPYEDYLYKWYLWCWAFGPLTADIPAVTEPDDHDVFHGNIWGAGGKATPPGLSGAAAQDAGGYKLPPDWVNMVQRTQSSHLPDPPDPAPAEQGIAVYFTDILYGGVSFAVIEDRKFKSAPAGLVPAGDIWNGWPRAPGFDAKTQADVPGAALLGERQLTFLERWANDWSGGAWMKVVLSQSPFANIATLPDSALTGDIIPRLPILEPGEYPEGERLASDMDSNGWPQTGRDRALRAMRKGFAVHLAGDQHLGATVQYGIDDWNDAGFVLSVPSIANFWPRRWFPPRPGANRDPAEPPYTGEYEDGFGNRMTVHAVSNPHRSGHEPALLHDLAPGYGIARFDRAARRVSLAAWPRWADPSTDSPYPGWPVVFDQESGYGGRTASLPTLDIRGMDDAVVQVRDSDTGEIVYTLRINGTRYAPRVPRPGTYMIGVGEPGTVRWTDVQAQAIEGERTDTIVVVVQ